MDSATQTAAPATTETPTPAPAPTPAHHFNLRLFLQVLFAVAPAVVAPFVPAGNATAIFNAEVPIEQAIAQALSDA
jgi:hypothetical protein